MSTIATLKMFSFFFFGCIVPVTGLCALDCGFFFPILFLSFPIDLMMKFDCLILFLNEWIGFK